MRDHTWPSMVATTSDHKYTWPKHEVSMTFRTLARTAEQAEVASNVAFRFSLRESGIDYEVLHLEEPPEGPGWHPELN